MTLTSLGFHCMVKFADTAHGREGKEGMEGSMQGIGDVPQP